MSENKEIKRILVDKQGLETYHKVLKEDFLSSFIELRDDLTVLREEITESSEVADVNEQVRLDNEIEREDNEAIRIAQEDIRIAEEDIRDANEEDRIDAEEERVIAENARANAENARAGSELYRTNQENNRQTVEASRVTKENERQSKEIERQQNESVRQSNETKRVNAETARVSQFNELKEELQKADIVNRIVALEQNDTVQDADIDWLKNNISDDLDARITAIEYKNKIQDTYINGLFNENNDKRLAMTEDKGEYNLIGSKAGLVDVENMVGNTIVNRGVEYLKKLILNDKINAEGTNVTLNNTIENGIVDVSLEGNTMVNLVNRGKLSLIQNYMYRIELEVTVNSTYTVYISNPANNLMWSVFNHDASSSIVHYTSNTLFTFNSSDNTKVNIYCRLVDENGNLASSGSIGSSSGWEKRINVFEGDLTQTPELIPTEYVEGLKSSFEDQLIPRDIATRINSLTLTQQEDGYYTSKDVTSGYPGMQLGTEELVEGKVYTFIIDIVENTLLSNDITIGGGDRIGFSTHIPRGKVGIYTYSFTYTKTDSITEPNTFWIGYSFSSTDEYVVFKKPILVEGDYTSNPPTYEEVVNYAGKYKVEYEVTNNNIELSDFEQGTFIQNGLVFEDCKATENDSYYPVRLRNSQLIPIDPTKTYYIKVNEGYEISPNFFDSSRIYIEAYGWVESFNHTSAKYFALVIRRSDGCNISLNEDIGLKLCTKKYTKTFYLNSPLLEGDTIEDINGVATHVKRYGKVVLDGSESWAEDYKLIPRVNTNLYRLPDAHIEGVKFAGKFVCNNFANADVYHNDIKGMSIYASQDNKLKVGSILLDLNEFKQWLQANPTTVVYELASPIYEELEVNSELLTYTDMTHISNNSTIPCNMVVKNKGMSCHLLQPNKQYTVVTNSSENIYANVGGGVYVVGKDNIVVTTPATLTDNKVRFYGKGIEIEEPMLLENGCDTNGYFEGIRSSFDEVDENGKYPVHISILNELQTIIDESVVLLNSPLLEGDEIRYREGKLYHYHKMRMVVLDGSEDEEWYKDVTAPVFKYRVENEIDNGAYLLAFCDNFTYMVGVIGTIGFNCFKVQAGYLQFRHISYDTLDTFKQWLSENPTTVVYELEQPYEEEIGGERIIMNIPENANIKFNSLVTPNSSVRYSSDVPSVYGLEATNEEQDVLINTSLLATDEMYQMIEPLLEVALMTMNISEGDMMSVDNPIQKGVSKMVDLYVAMVIRGLKKIEDIPVRYRAEVKRILEELEK